ncbi:MAG: DUF1844 domain-containing protein [Phycisphaerae bacterium]
MGDENSTGGLHIDSDWKTEAAREKERLAREEAAAQPQSDPQEAPSPGPSFNELVNILAMQAAIALGGYEGPGGERIPPSLRVAKHHIDLLDVLEQKTKGNLTDDEKRALDTVLYELRMQYVQAVSGAVPDAAGGEYTSA